jgi:hypothetical protein
MVGVVVAIAVSRIPVVIPRIAVVPWTVARAVIPAIAIGVPPVLIVAIRISISMAAVFDLLDVSGVHRYCVWHNDRRSVNRKGERHSQDHGCECGQELLHHRNILSGC